MALSIHVCKWVPANLILGVNLPWTFIPSRNELEILSIASCYGNRAPAGWAPLLVCKVNLYFLFLTGEVRLVDGGTSNQGRIEIYLNDTWWAICKNHFSWNAFEIVCNMINLPEPHERYYESEFGRGNQSILAMDFSCDGHESSLLDCHHESYYEHHYGDEVVGVSCGELVMTGKRLRVFARIFYSLISILTQLAIRA